MEMITSFRLPRRVALSDWLWVVFLWSTIISLQAACVEGVRDINNDSTTIERVHNNTHAQITTKPLPPPHPLRIQIQSKLPVILINLKAEKNVTMNYTLVCDHPSTVYVVMAKTLQDDVATVIAGNPATISCRGGRNRNNRTLGIGTNATERSDNGATDFEISGEIVMRFESHQIGRSFLLMFATKIAGPEIPPRAISSSNATAIHTKYGNRTSESSKKKAHAPAIVLKGMVLSMQLPRPIDEIFRVVIYITIIVATIGMGIKVELEVVIKVMKKPLGPIIGLFCQYVCMPLIAYAVAKLVPQPSASISLGIFACGIAPGGGASNIYCYLLGGDLSLSVAMTTISSILSLGFLPLWMFTLGDTFHDETANIHIPYLKVLESLALVILPILCGMIIKYKSPKVAKVISKILKPVLVIVILLVLTLGIYANIFIFNMIKPMQILAGCLLPYIGYVIGGLIAFLSCQSWCHIKTIAIETGIQNVGVTFMILYTSLAPPDNQLAIVAPAASSIMTPLPLLPITLFYVLYNRRKKRKEAEELAAMGDLDELEENGLTGKQKHLVDNSPAISNDERSPCEKIFCRKREDHREEQLLDRDENGNGESKKYDPDRLFVRETFIDT